MPADQCVGRVVGADERGGKESPEGPGSLLAIIELSQGSIPGEHLELEVRQVERSVGSVEPGSIAMGIRRLAQRDRRSAIGGAGATATVGPASDSYARAIQARRWRNSL